MILGDALKKPRDSIVKLLKLDRNTESHKIFKIITTFILINFSWIFFRANSFNQAYEMTKSIYTQFNPWAIFDGSLFNIGLDSKDCQVLIIAIILLFIADFAKWKGHSIREWVYKQSIWFRWCFYIISIFVVLIFGIWGPEFNEQAFIYFQF